LYEEKGKLLRRGKPNGSGGAKKRGLMPQKSRFSKSNAGRKKERDPRISEPEKTRQNFLASGKGASGWAIS